MGTTNSVNKKHKQKLLGFEQIDINYHNFSAYYVRDMKKLKDYMSSDIFDVICDQIDEVSNNTRPDIRKKGHWECNWILMSFVIFLIFILFGIFSYDYFNKILGIISIILSLIFLLLSFYLCKKQRPLTFLWWDEFIIGLQIKINEINKFFNDNKIGVYLSLINFDEENDENKNNNTNENKKKNNTIDDNDDDNIKGLYHCKLIFNWINSDKKNKIKINDIQIFKKCFSKLDYPSLKKHQISQANFVTIDDDDDDDVEIVEDEVKRDVTDDKEIVVGGGNDKIEVEDDNDNAPTVGSFERL